MRDRLHCDAGDAGLDGHAAFVPGDRGCGLDAGELVADQRAVREGAGGVEDVGEGVFSVGAVVAFVRAEVDVDVCFVGAGR